MQALPQVRKTIAVAIVAAAFPLGASAAVTTYIGYDNAIWLSGGATPNANAAAAAFDAATGNLARLTFESALPAGVTVDLGTVVSQPTGSNCGPYGCGNNITPGGSYYVEKAGGAVIFNFTTPIDSFGMYVSGLNADLVGQQVLTFNDGTLQAINIPKTISDGGTVFIGFTDIGKQIVKVTYDASFDYVGFDDVRYGIAAPVPEPSTYAMLLAGLAIAGATIRRRR